RAGGRLTLDDGTLAGADLELARAVQILTTRVGLSLEQSLAMATAIPADLMQLPHGPLRKGGAADFVHLGADFRLAGVWQNGVRVKS
ncbi:MAG TPA: N-acetylglucosamine-6-phosphate deacetylase, partial [Rhodobacterales bacterium]|nr:N-acetylglucosamine-6-phosphate deacetylase [Rhodobacterales bacterium]